MMHDRLDILPHIVEAVLNHVSGHRAGVAGVYNRAKYLSPMRAALARWADFVDELSGEATCLPSNTGDWVTLAGDAVVTFGCEPEPVRPRPKSLTLVRRS
jgi:hypothetical protein